MNLKVKLVDDYLTEYYLHANKYLLGDRENALIFHTLEDALREANELMESHIKQAADIGVTIRVVSCSIDSLGYHETIKVSSTYTA